MILNESIGLAALSTTVGVIMSDATWALLIGQVGIVAIMVVKDRRDRTNREQDRLDREQDRLDRESAARLLASKVETSAILLAGKVERSAVMGGEREGRIIAKVEKVEQAVLENSKSPQQMEIVGTFESHVTHETQP